MNGSKTSFNYRRSIRLHGYDYRRNGVYFVTICTYRKMKLFGNIIDGEMALSRLGEVACAEWCHIADARDNVDLDRFVIMPNHMHGLFVITDRIGDVLSQPVEMRHPNQSRGFPSGSLGAIVGHYKAAVSRRAWSGLIGRNLRIWQRNYYDHIVRSEKSLHEIRRYIIENPARWHEDNLYVD